MRARALVAALALAAVGCGGGGTAPVVPGGVAVLEDVVLTIDEVVAVRTAGAVAVARFTVHNVGGALLSVPRCGDAISWRLVRLEDPVVGPWATVSSTEICQANLRTAPLLLARGESARGSVLLPAAGRYRLVVRYAHAVDAATAARAATSAPFDAP